MTQSGHCIWAAIEVGRSPHTRSSAGLGKEKGPRQDMGGPRVWSGEDPSPENNSEKHVGSLGSLIWIKPSSLDRHRSVTEIAAAAGTATPDRYFF